MSPDRAVLESKLRIGIAQLPHLRRAIALVWQAARPWTVAWVFLLVIQGLLPVVTVYLTRALVDSLVVALQAASSWSAFRAVLPFAVGMGVVLLLAELLRHAEAYVREVQAELVRDHISGLIHDQAVAVDLAFYDASANYDRLYRAQYHATDRPLALVENVGGAVQNSLTLLAMAVVLLPYGVWLPMALLATSLPALYIVLEHRLRYHHWRIKNTERDRRAWYYNWLLTDRDAAAEMRIFDLGKHFQGKYRTLREKLRRESVQLSWDQAIAELAAATAGLLITGATTAWMLWRAVQGNLTLGDLALFHQAFLQGQRLMGTLFSNLGEIYSNSLYLTDLFGFLAVDSQVTDPARPATIPPRVTEGIRFDRVTFRYPGSDRVALRDFDLTIPAGRIVAIVGANGAGKSTLVKLLCRFYDPDEGRVLLDGVDLRSFRLSELRRQITILFQEPVHYQDTVSENIRLGNLSVPRDPREVELAAVAAGAAKPIEGLPQGYDTLLGKWFKDGTELSVGEWQRLALARAYWRQAPILILDEPTSAMDPWAEHDWLQRFRMLAAGRTTVIITHRFTTAMYADTIHVVEEGRVVESGSHSELLARGGRYGQSWEEQMQTARVKSGQAPRGRRLLQPEEV